MFHMQSMTFCRITNRHLLHSTNVARAMGKRCLNGEPCPVLYSVTSDRFQIVKTTETDQVQPSTQLVAGREARPETLLSH